MMQIHIPTPLRPYSGKQPVVDVAAHTVAEALTALITQFPDLRKHLYTEQGKLRAFVNVYLNDEDVRYIDQKENAPVKDSDSISIIPSIAGGLPTTSAPSPATALTPEEMSRYSRHLILPEVGEAGQLKLKAARVLCIGAGGLGAPLTMYLAAAGVGTLGIVDFDVVEASNLHRQVIHGTSDVGRPKLDSAEDSLKAINPNVKIVKFETRLTSENAMQIFKDFDIIADGTDNFPTRYLVNDACVLSDKPNVYASIFRFEGQASVFGAAGGPCYRCLYPEPPPPGLVPSCAEGGVLGILPGLLGIVQATEVIKLILGEGEPLVGRLLLVDTLAMRFRELKLHKNPECPSCGAQPTVTSLIDYEQFCGLSSKSTPPAEMLNGIPQMQVEDLKRRMDAAEDLFLLDVREPYEFAIAQLGGHLIPLNDLPQRVRELDASREIIVHCKMGGRSQIAAEFLAQNGFKRIHNLAGGIAAWSEKVDPNVPKY
ncbi:MAG: molybdopterin-synthase adenylyltransferase MoeB [Terriglobia bacterium]|nr:molybdopterin-synthase adenylyltransferase MoeB [Terriglobia bacterium]